MYLSKALVAQGERALRRYGDSQARLAVASRMMLDSHFMALTLRTSLCRELGIEFPILSAAIGGGGELLWGDSAVLVEMSAPAGFAAPSHAHDHESVYVLSGRIRASVEGEARELGPGDAVVHGAGARHQIEALADTRWIEIKAPPSATWPAVGRDA